MIRCWRGVAPGKRNVCHVAEPLEAGGRGAQDLAAPDCPVRAVACSVHREAQDLAFQTVLGAHGRDVSVMVLDAD